MLVDVLVVESVGAVVGTRFVLEKVKPSAFEVDEVDVRRLEEREVVDLVVLDCGSGCGCGAVEGVVVPRAKEDEHRNTARSIHLRPATQ